MGELRGYVLESVEYNVELAKAIEELKTAWNHFDFAQDDTQTSIALYEIKTAELRIDYLRSNPIEDETPQKLTFKDILMSMYRKVVRT